MTDEERGDSVINQRNKEHYHEQAQNTQDRNEL